jgi:hypothetical protein
MPPNIVCKPWLESFSSFRSCLSGVDKNIMKTIHLLLAALFVVSCNVEKREKAPGSTPVEVTEEAPAAPAFDVKDANSLIGQKLEVVQPALEAAQIRFRVIEKDGESFPMTMDYLPERLNFKIKDGVIIEVSKG